MFRGALLVLAGSALAFAGCDAADERPPIRANGGNGAGGNAAGGQVLGGGGEQSLLDSGTGPDLDSGLRPKQCDAVTGRCTCVNLLAYGVVEGQANEKDTTAFRDWLNTKSTANVTLTAPRQTLTKDYLEQYDVIILQALGDSNAGPYWTFSAEEVAALQDWVETFGGGIIALTGYGSNSEEVNPLNQLLAFTGISYNKDDILANCPDNLCYCWGNDVPIGGWSATHPAALDITQVGGFHGRSINPGDAEVIATQGGIVYAAGKQVGKGKVFAFADEWVIYSNQWLSGVDHSNIPQAEWQYNPCYDTAAAEWRDAAYVFQVPQFWYNVVGWVSPPSECDFTITDDRIILH
jgi:hypothetical protein